MVDSILHGVAVLLAAWAAGHPGDAYALSDARQADGPVTTYGGVVAWWGSERGKNTRLTVWRAGRPPRRLRVSMSPRHRMLDVGPGPDGAPWVVYPKCTNDGRCAIWGYDLRTARAQDLRVGEGVAAAIWHQTVVVVRQSRPSAPSELLVATVGQGGAAAKPLSLPRHGGPAFGDTIGLDLRGDRVALSAWESGDDVRFASLVAGTLGDTRHAQIIGTGGSGEECTTTVSSPTLTAHAITWLHATTATYGSCRRIRELRRRDFATGARSYARVGAVSSKQAVVAGSHMITLSPWPHDNGANDREACGPDWMAQDPKAIGCMVRLLPAARWHAGETGG